MGAHHSRMNALKRKGGSLLVRRESSEARRPAARGRVPASACLTSVDDCRQSTQMANSKGCSRPKSSSKFKLRMSSGTSPPTVELDERSRKEWVAYYLQIGDVESARKLGWQHDRAARLLQARVRSFLKLRNKVARFSGPELSELMVTVVEAVGLPRRVFGPSSSFVCEVGGGTRGIATAPLGASRAQWLQSLRVPCHSFHGYGGAQREPGPAPTAAGVAWPDAQADAKHAHDFLRVRVIDLARRGDGDMCVGACYVHIGNAVEAGRRAREAAAAANGEDGSEPVPPLGEWVPLWLPRGRAPVAYVRLYVTSPEPGRFPPTAGADGVAASPRAQRALFNDFEAERQAAGLGASRRAADRAVGARPIATGSAEGLFVSLHAARDLPQKTGSAQLSARFGSAHALTHAQPRAPDGTAAFRSNFSVPASLPASAADRKGLASFRRGGCIAIQLHDAASRSKAEPDGKLLGSCVVPLPPLSASGELDCWFALSPPTAPAAASAASEAGEQARAQTTGISVRVALSALRDEDGVPRGGTLTLGGAVMEGTAVPVPSAAAASATRPGAPAAALAAEGDFGPNDAPLPSAKPEPEPEEDNDRLPPGLLAPRLIYTFHSTSTAASARAKSARARSASSKSMPDADGAPRQVAVQARQLTDSQLRSLPPAMAAKLAEILARKAQPPPPEPAAVPAQQPKAAAKAAPKPATAAAAAPAAAPVAPAAEAKAAAGEGKDTPSKAKAGTKGKGKNTKLKKSGKKVRTTLFF